MKLILKELRGNKKQIDICKELNISTKNFSNYETGRSEPDFDTLEKLANYFDVSLDYLCGRQYSNNIGYVAEDRRETIKSLSKLDDDEFKKVEGYVKALLDSKK